MGKLVANLIIPVWVDVDGVRSNLSFRWRSCWFWAREESLVNSTVVDRWNRIILRSYETAKLPGLKIGAGSGQRAGIFLGKT
jgi:hypothetical protein